MTEPKGSDVQSAQDIPPMTDEEKRKHAELSEKLRLLFQECSEFRPNEMNVSWGLFAYKVNKMIQARVQAAIEELTEKLDIVVRTVECDADEELANDYGGTGWELDERIERVRKAMLALEAREQAAAVEMRERCARYVESCRDERNDVVQVFDVMARHIANLPIPTSALDAALLRARINEHDRGCIVPLCPSEPCGRRRELMRQLAALTRPAPEKEPRRWTR